MIIVLNGDKRIKIARQKSDIEWENEKEEGNMERKGGLLMGYAIRFACQENHE